MTTRRLENPNGTALIAVFEKISDAVVIVSAILSITTYRYKDVMNIEEAGRYWQKLISEGWQAAPHRKETHQDIWNATI